MRAMPDDVEAIARTTGLSRFAIVNVARQRAHELVDGAPPIVSSPRIANPVAIALKELACRQESV